MLKPSSSFKLSKSAKRLMAATADKEKSNQIKNMMIQAEIHSAVQVKSSKHKDKE